MEAVKQMITKIKGEPLADAILRALLVVLLLYFFLIGVNTLSSGLKLMGSGFAKTLFDISGHPFISLMAGMLATVLFQSSSVTTSIIVGLVSAGTLSVNGAIPMIMGANLGTSVTNTLVSLGFLKNKLHFKRAIAAATVHDFFNILTVAILLPIELMTGFIEKMATSFSSLLYGSIAGLHYKSPIKAMIKPPVKGIKAMSLETFGQDIAGIVMLILAGIFIIASLTLIVKTMKKLVESNKGELINKILSKNAYGAVLFGMLLTIAVQSSSITTSLLVPMAGSGLLSLANVFPITVGANIGTTTTALLASLTGNVAGLSIALVHLLFNLLGMMIFFPIPKMRQIPIKLAELLGKGVERNKAYGLAYVAVVFFVIPLSFVFIFR